MKLPECFQLPWLYVVTELQSGRSEMCSKEEWSYEKLSNYNIGLFSKLEVDGAFKLNRKNRGTKVPETVMLLLKENKGHMQLKLSG